jgi:hypothetical protein
MKNYVVRVVQTKTDDGYPINEGGIIDWNFLDCLALAGSVVIHQTEQFGFTEKCFDIRCPDKEWCTRTQMHWANNLAARMQDLGFNAVSAPSTE